MTEDNLYKTYEKYKTEFFPKLLNTPGVPQEDKDTITALLQKPWNPYVLRHSVQDTERTCLTSTCRMEY